MTDRELLEAAAKAAGIDLQHRAMFGGDAEPGYYKYPVGVPPLWTWWNPLTDDGDAMRLAVKLRMLIEPAKTMGGTFIEVHAHPSGRGDCAGVEQFGQDDFAATRRAIVRAAAEIGKMT